MTLHYADDWLTVYGGDCRAVLATLPAESVHCVVTSPPYWGLRDYGTAAWDGGDEAHAHVGTVMRTMPAGSEKQASNRGAVSVTSGDCACGARRIDNQLGLEPTPEEYIANMVAVFREVRRVLRRDGTLWLNLGDSYTSGNSGQRIRNSNGGFGGTDGRRTQSATAANPGRPAYGAKPKDLVGIPWRVAFALQADGWYLRSDIIWAKPNPMPESVTDRPTKSHEYLFLFAKSERYYFDADAVRESSVGTWNSAEDWGGRMAMTAPELAKGADPERQRTRGFGTFHADEERTGRNIRSVWTIPTQPYPGAHFAVFPPKLVEPCIKAGTSERGVCAECGAPWRRVVERGERFDLSSVAHRISNNDRLAQNDGGVTEKSNGQEWARWKREHPDITTSWQPSCAHDAATVAAVVCDPFAGSGTTGLVAQRLSRRALLVDLNPDYLRQQLERNAAVPLGLVG